MKRKFVRIYLDEIQVLYNGDEVVNSGSQTRQPNEDDEDALDNSILASMEYPRSGVSLVSTLKTMDLPSRYPYNLSNKSIWVRGLFKEEIQDETILSIVVSDKDKRSAFTRWFSNIFGVVLNAYLGKAAAGISNIYAGAVAGDLQSNIVKGVKGSDDKSITQAIATTGDVFMTLEDNGIRFALKHDDDGVVYQPNDEIKLELKSPSVLQTRKPPFPGKSPEYKTVIDKKQPNGYITISYEWFDV